MLILFWEKIREAVWNAKVLQRGQHPPKTGASQNDNSVASLDNSIASLKIQRECDHMPTVIALPAEELNKGTD